MTRKHGQNTDVFESIQFKLTTNPILHTTNGKVLKQNNSILILIKYNKVRIPDYIVI